MSLVELMVALLLLGVILSAGASALTQFGRAAADNERRVQATALLNRMHEELQALSWDDAVVYEGDLEQLLDEGFEGLEKDPSWTFGGLDIATIAGPEEGYRNPEVPVLREQVEIDDRTYDVIRLVTWSDRRPDVKRFITIVQWQVYERVYQERFLSERAATALEAGDPVQARVIQFQVGPSPMRLLDVEGEPPARNQRDLLVTVRFSEGVDTAELTYRSVLNNPGEGYPLKDHSLALEAYIWDEEGAGLAWKGQIPAQSHTFANGSWPFDLVGTRTDPETLIQDELTGRTSVRFLDGSLDMADVGGGLDGGDGSGTGTPESPVAITSTSVVPDRMCLDNGGRLVNDVVVEARIDGLEPDLHDVVATYTTDRTTRTDPLEPEIADFDTTDAVFRLVLEAGSDYGFKPGNSPEETTFVIDAIRVGSDDAAQARSPVLSIVKHNATECGS